MGFPLQPVLDKPRLSLCNQPVRLWYRFAGIGMRRGIVLFYFALAMPVFRSGSPGIRQYMQEPVKFLVIESYSRCTYSKFI